MPTEQGAEKRRFWRELLAELAREEVGPVAYDSDPFWLRTLALVAGGTIRDGIRPMGGVR